MDALNDCRQQEHLIVQQGYSYFWEAVKKSPALARHLDGVDDVILSQLVTTLLRSAKTFLDDEAKKRAKALAKNRPFVPETPSPLAVVVRAHLQFVDNCIPAKDDRVRVTLPPADVPVGRGKVRGGGNSVTVDLPSSYIH